MAGSIYSCQNEAMTLCVEPRVEISRAFIPVGYGVRRTRSLPDRGMGSIGFCGNVRQFYSDTERSLCGGEERVAICGSSGAFVRFVDGWGCGLEAHETRRVKLAKRFEPD
jgi:hypothetical protein